MKNKTLYILSLLFLSFQCSAQSTLIGHVEANGDFTLTAPTQVIDSIFDSYSIFNHFDADSPEITYDSVVNEYYLEAMGIGHGPELGNTLAMRVGISLVRSDFQWDMMFGLGAEKCTDNPCSNCKFALGGGCECRNGGTGDKCNHTITR